MVVKTTGGSVPDEVCVKAQEAPGDTDNPIAVLADADAAVASTLLYGCFVEGAGESAVNVFFRK